MLALIDADVIVHAELNAAQSRDYFGDGTSVDLGRALSCAHDTIAEWTAAAQADHCILIFSPQDRRNFRQIFLDIGYKDNRTSDKDDSYWELEGMLKNAYPWYCIDLLEGDDVIGIMHTSEQMDEPTVCISIDKDMKTLPGLLYNPSKMTAPVRITRNQATWFWMYQTLMGDQVDGYKGCPRIGEVKAKRILPTPDAFSEEEFLHRCWDWVYGTYLATYGDKAVAQDQAVAQARAARILHAEDYHKGAIRLWHPDAPEWVELEA